MQTKSQEQKPLEPFLPSDHMRLNELVQHISYVEAKSTQFVLDMQAKREKYNRYPKLTVGQRNYLKALHDKLVNMSLVSAVAA